MAQLAAATSADVMGSTVEIDGAPCGAVKKSLSQKEALSFAGGQFAVDGLLVEGIRLTVDVTTLPYRPMVGGEVDIDGDVYDVKAIAKSGDKWRITMLRYLA